MRITIGAIKAIRDDLGIDLLESDGSEDKGKRIAENFQRIAELALRWEKKGVTDEQAKEASMYVTVGEIIDGITESFGDGSK